MGMLCQDMSTRIPKDVFFAVCSRSKPVPQARNDCFHQCRLTLVNGPLHNMLMQFFTLDS